MKTDARRADVLRMRRAALAALVVPLAVPLLTAFAWVPAAPAATSAPVLGTTCRAFGAGTWWHARVDTLPVHARSGQWLGHMSAATRRLHPDFGADPGGAPYGIPVTVAAAGTPKVAVRFEYADESDAGPYPLTASTLIEGGSASTGDRHAVVVDAGTCTLYETYGTRRTPTGWTAGSGAVWSLASARLRPAGWTSADAAGLPILPGLLRLEEVRRGVVDHPIRFTTDVTDRRYVWPARHQAGSVSDPTYPPMGARFRLKAGYPLTGLRADTRVVLLAMKRYGLVLADNGSPWFFQGQASQDWPDGLLDELKAVPANAFEAVDTSSLLVDPNSMKVVTQTTAAASRGFSTPLRQAGTAVVRVSP